MNRIYLFMKTDGHGDFYGIWISGRLYAFAHFWLNEMDLGDWIC
jgi:hypothetical protein